MKILHFLLHFVGLLIISFSMLQLPYIQNKTFEKRKAKSNGQAKTKLAAARFTNFHIALSAIKRSAL